MGTFAPLLADSLKGFNKYFLSFLVNKGFQALAHTPEGIKGKKGIKVGQARIAQKGVTTFHTLIPFIPALCVSTCLPIDAADWCRRVHSYGRPPSLGPFTPICTRRGTISGFR